MSLINCKTYLELNWTKNCVMYGHNTYIAVDDVNHRQTIFKITNCMFQLLLYQAKTM